VPFTVLVVDLDETRLPDEPPNNMVARLASGKATTAKNWFVEHGKPVPAILGADTCVVIDKEILGKPASRCEAVCMLHKLSGQTHQVYTGIALLSGTAIQTQTVVSEVTFTRLTSAQIENYCDGTEPFDKAGAYAIQGMGATIIKEERLTPYSLRYEIKYDKDLMAFSKKIESVPMVEILSIGKSLELIKDIGDAKQVCDRYNLSKIKGTHAIGHARMATESGVDIKSAHPFWGYPFSDVSVVHNGQLTNYWNNRRALENKGMRFMSECDSELIAVYLAEKMRNGATLAEGMKDSLAGLDGVFTYFVATKDSLGMAKDTMAAKPLVLYESDNLIAMGSEEIAIRAILPQEIDTYDPFDGEVKVWQI